jgi:hypothetical protein
MLVWSILPICITFYMHFHNVISPPSLVLCSILYASEDPSIAGMVLDSPFSNLFNLMLELADVYKIRLPKFTVSVIDSRCPLL